MNDRRKYMTIALLILLLGTVLGVAILNLAIWLTVPPSPIGLNYDGTFEAGRIATANAQTTTVDMSD